MSYALSFSMKPSSALPIAKLRTLEPDGRIMITVGEQPIQFRSIVSSHHLVEEKIIRLQSYWLKATQNQEL
jgi:hypothetical protein